MPVTEALDRVLEILRTTELYSPQFGAKDDDPHGNDLVGGLISVSVLTRPLAGACCSCLSFGYLYMGSLHVRLSPGPNPSIVGLGCSVQSHRPPAASHLGTQLGAEREEHIPGTVC